MSCKCKFEFDGRTCNSRQKWNNDQCKFECKKKNKTMYIQKGYTWNPSICASEFEEEIEIGEYLKNCTCMKNLVDNWQSWTKF